MKKNKLVIKIFFLCTIVLLGFFVYPAIQEMGRKNKIEEEISVLKGEREKLEKDNYFLKERISYFETEEYKERVAKEKLSLKKTGEKVVVVSPFAFRDDNNEEEIDDNSSDVIIESNMSDIPNYGKWWNYFFE
ncbi:septum formation initiator family protein [Patescibacteria group bacterium]